MKGKSSRRRRFFLNDSYAPMHGLFFWGVAYEIPCMMSFTDGKLTIS